MSENNKKLPHPFALAPMAEITTPALRRTIKEFTGNVLLYSEMLSAAAIVSGVSYNENRMQKLDFDDPFVFQLMGNSPDIMGQACEILSDIGCYGIDINMGCSAPVILQKGLGSGLLKEPEKAREIVRVCRKKTTSSLSVKLRSGFEKHDEEFLIDFTRMLQDEGVDFIALHPRFAKLGFARKADWSLVKSVKKHLSIPVLGNGDISSAEMAMRKINETGCDGIMIGREAVTAPWIFKLCDDIYHNNPSSLSVDILQVFINTLDYLALYLPEYLHKSRAHRFCVYYCKNAKFGHELFRKIRNVDSINEMKSIVYDYYERNEGEREKKFEV
ncbi:MAG: tRNA-dihydrouridine synthase family protein [bacterium]|nr:tRNA-dihydrouridine synthase family protein [bacterium]